MVRYSANHATPRHSLPRSPNCSRRQAFANIPAIMMPIGMPQTRKPATPMNVQLDFSADECPKAERTWSDAGWARPSSRMISVPGLALSANPLMYAKPMIINGMTVVKNCTDTMAPSVPPSISLKRAMIAATGLSRRASANRR